MSVVFLSTPEGLDREWEGARNFMVDSSKISILEVSRLAKGDVLITFSDDTVVLYHAKFLYDVRSQDSNVEIVDPFTE